MDIKEIQKVVNMHLSSIRRIAAQNNITKRITCNLLPNEVFYPMDKLGFSRYEVSNFARFKRKQDNIIIQHSYTVDKYQTIKLVHDDGKRKINRVHKLMALMFLPPNDDPLNKTEINHIDGNKDNNRPENLEYITPSDNLKHAYNNKLRKSTKGMQIRCHNEQDVIKVCELIKENNNISTYAITKIYPSFDKKWIKRIRNKEIYKDITDKYF